MQAKARKRRKHCHITDAGVRLAKVMVNFECNDVVVEAFALNFVNLGLIPLPSCILCLALSHQIRLSSDC